MMLQTELPAERADGSLSQLWPEIAAELLANEESDGPLLLLLNALGDHWQPTLAQ